MGQHQSDLVTNKKRYIISLSIAKIIIFSFEYLFQFLSKENLTAFQTFKLTCYFEIPNFCIFIIAILVILFINEKNIIFLKKYRKHLTIIISTLSIFIFVALTIIYEVNLNNDEYFLWPISLSGLFLTIVDYPWLTKKSGKIKNAVKMMIQVKSKSHQLR